MVHNPELGVNFTAVGVAVEELQSKKSSVLSARSGKHAW